MAKVLDRVRRGFTARLGRKESGAGTFIFIFFGIILIALPTFGVVFDLGGAQYARQSLQQDLNAATQSALSSAVNPTAGNQPTVSITQAVANTTAIYTANRQHTLFLACVGGPYTPVPGGYTVKSDPNGACPFLYKNATLTHDPNTKRWTFTITIREYTQYEFLQMMGMHVQAYNLTSTATLTSSYHA